MSIANTVKGIIIKKGYKQKTIAIRMGISERQFSDIVCSRKKVGAEDIPKLARALEVTPNELFNFQENIKV